jgi:hypothetical protein
MIISAQQFPRVKVKDESGHEVLGVDKDVSYEDGKGDKEKDKDGGGAWTRMWKFRYTFQSGCIAFLHVFLLILQPRRTPLPPPRSNNSNSWSYCCRLRLRNIKFIRLERQRSGIMNSIRLGIIRSGSV